MQEEMSMRLCSNQLRFSDALIRCTMHALRAIPLEQIIQDITAMGFQRHQVMTVVNNLQRDGQAVDLNVILDRLTRGDYR